MIIFPPDSTNKLTAEGEENLKNGSAEFRVASYVQRHAARAALDGRRATSGATTTRAALDDHLGKEVCGVGFGKAMKNKWISLDKGSGAVSCAVVEALVDEVQTQLSGIADGSLKDEKILKELKARKLIKVGFLGAVSVCRGGYEVLDCVVEDLFVLLL